jgi:hypothetical protein
MFEDHIDCGVVSFCVFEERLDVVDALCAVKLGCVKVVGRDRFDQLRHASHVSSPPPVRQTNN